VASGGWLGLSGCHGSASLDAMGGGVHDGIGALPDGIGLCPHATVPAWAGHGGGTVELARRPCGGIVRILRRLSEPPGGRRWPPVGGPASLEAMGSGVHDGIGALPDGIGLCPLATVPARARNGGTGSPPVRGHRQRSLFRREVPYSVVHPAAHGLQRGWATLRSYWQPPGGSESLHKIGTMPPQGRTRNGGTGSPPVRGHRQNFTKALRAVGRPPVASGGWLGLSGGHGRRGARRNMGVTRRNRHLPAREDARKGWERWNWLAACAGASLEFFEGSPSRRWAVGGLRRVARPLWRPLAAGYSTE